MKPGAPLRPFSEKRLAAMSAAGQAVPFSTLARGRELARGRSLQFATMDRMRGARARLAQIPSDELDLAITAVRWQFEPLNRAAREIGCDPAALDEVVLAACRASVFRRDEFCPCGCGKPPEQMQHIVARGMGGTDDSRIRYGMSRLLGMCAPSHARAESRSEETHFFGWWLRQDEDPAEHGVMFFESPGGSGVTLYLRDDGTRWPYPPEGVAG